MKKGDNTVMNFELNEQQLSIQKMARDFTEKKVAPKVLERDETREYDRSLYEDLCSMGFIGLPYEKEYGGEGLGYMEYALAIEEISKVDPSLSVSFSVATSLYGGSLHFSKATDEQLKRFLPPVLKGNHLGSFGLTEHTAGSDVSGMLTFAERKGDEYIINGSKCFISNMGPNEGDYVILIALTEPSLKTKGLSAIIVDRDTPGFSVGKTEDKMGIRSAAVSELIFNDCCVPRTQLLGKEGKGFSIAMAGLDSGRIGIASQAVGLCQGAINAAVTYSSERTQFGKPINANQGIQWYLADMATRTEAALQLTINAARLHDAGMPITKEASMAKYYASEAAVYVTNKALQIHGGYGYMKDYAIERMYRDARIIPLYEGTSEVQKMVISRAVISGK